MKLATWNVNSLNVRLPRLLGWLASEAPDVVCLQETKIDDERFPRLELEAAGYKAAIYGQKTYNGVAILTRNGLVASDVTTGWAGHEDTQKRVIAATIADTRVVCVYVPNGQAVGSDKYAYKLDWCSAATHALKAELARYPRLALAGDLNIAPADADVHDPALWEGQIMCSASERAAFRDWISLGTADSFRLFEQPPNTFSWWDYRMLAFPKNRGLRIDHILLSPSLAGRCTACRIDRNMRKGDKPSDHAPVIVELAP